MCVPRVPYKQGRGSFFRTTVASLENCERRDRSLERLVELHRSLTRSHEADSMAFIPIRIGLE